MYLIPIVYPISWYAWHYLHKFQARIHKKLETVDLFLFFLVRIHFISGRQLLRNDFYSNTLFWVKFLNFSDSVKSLEVIFQGLFSLVSPGLQFLSPTTEKILSAFAHGFGFLGSCFVQLCEFVNSSWGNWYYIQLLTGIHLCHMNSFSSSGYPGKPKLDFCFQLCEVVANYASCTLAVAYEPASQLLLLHGLEANKCPEPNFCCTTLGSLQHVLLFQNHFFEVG